jgi:tetratricopeptide (TPR) repeat protein
MRQYDQSIEEYKKLLEMNPDFYTARYWLAYPYAFKGMYDEAVATIDEAMAASEKGSPILWASKGFIYSFAGKMKEAKKTLDQMLEQSKKIYISPWMIAAVYAGLGEKDKAFDWIERAFEERDHWLIYIKVSTIVDNLRSDPRFHKSLERMGLS